MAYSTETLVKQYFGTDNVDAWCKSSGTESGATVTTRMTAFIVYADAIIDARLRGSKLQFNISLSTTPSIIELISILLAGSFAYEATGVRASGGEGGKSELTYHREWALKMLDQIVAGELDLNV